MIDMYHKLTYSKVGKFADILETALNICDSKVGKFSPMKVSFYYILIYINLRHKPSTWKRTQSK